MLKRHLISAALLLPLVCPGQNYNPGYSDLYEGETVTAMKESVAYLASSELGGRKAGSDGEKKAAEYFEKQLAEYGVEILSPKGGQIFGIRTETDTLVSRNVYGAVQGYDKELKNHYIVIGARLDNMGSNVQNINGESRTQIYYGANGNASGLAMLLQLARRLQTNSVLLRRSVIIAAFGASVPLQAGSWYFLKGVDFSGVGNIDAMINLDMLGRGSLGFYAYSASNPDMNNIITKLSGTLQPVQPRLVGMEPVASDHRSFYNKQIPSVFFTSGMYPEYNTVKDVADCLDYDYMERELEYIYNYTVALANGPAPSFKQSEEVRKMKYSSGDVIPYADCDVKPSFLGSNEPSSFLIKWVYTYLRYPEDCVLEGIQGRVLVDFIIDEKGRVGNVKVLRSLDPRLDEEAVRVISASPNWKPGKLRGNKVKSEVSMYVEFRLKKRKH